MNTTKKNEFSPLPFEYRANKSFFDKPTIGIQYRKTGKAHFNNFPNIIKGKENEKIKITDRFRDISKYPAAVIRSFGGYNNHTAYWEGMKNKGKILLKDKLLEMIIKTFNSFEEFKNQFSKACKTRFYGGWDGLYIDDKDSLFIYSSPNQDKPLTDNSETMGIPLLTMDFWEHAYYLEFQNKNKDYLEAFWDIINWEEVTKRYENALIRKNQNNC